MPNDSLIHADIFFFISTIALVVLSIGFGIALFYGIKILKNTSDVSDRIRAESADIMSDMRHFRLVLRDEGIKWRHVVNLVHSFFVTNTEKKTTSRKGKVGGETKTTITK